MKASVVQLRSDLDPATNREAAHRAVLAAAGAGARLVALPEATMCGLGAPGADLTALAEPLEGPFVAALAEAAAATGATVVAGTFEPVPGEPRVYNVGPGGLVAARPIENTAYVTVAVRPGPTDTGHSTIVDPFGVQLGELGDSDGAPEPALLTAGLERRRVDEARAALPVLAHRRVASGPAESLGRR